MRKIISTLLLLVGSACLLNAVVCENTADIILLALMLIFVLSELVMKGRRLTAMLMAGVAAGLWSIHTQLSLALALYALILIASDFVAPYRVRAFWRLFGSLMCFACGLYFLYQSCAIPATILRFQPRKIALLQRGVWGVEHPHRSELNITSQYSYDMLRTITGASLLNNVSELERYSDLVLITPTEPFTEGEIECIRKWVLSGGHLIVMTDHTDLFGHVRVLEPLLSHFGIEAVKDCIIECQADECTYYKLFDKYNGLTSNSLKGRGEAFMWQMGYSERADYAEPSFFSDNQVTDEDKPGIYAVAMNSSYGKGFVTVFGDSTLFANFALSLPSSQKILREILTPGVMRSIYGVFSFLLFIFLCSGKYVFMQLIGAGFIIMWLVAVGSSSLSPEMELHSEGVIPISVEGDQHLVEKEYRTIFAAAYASRIFPVWHGKKESMLKPGTGIYTSLNDIESPWEQGNEPMHRLVAQCSCTLNEYLDALIKDSKNKTFWFDSGAGLLREFAYRKFWLACMEQEWEEAPEFDEAVQRAAILTTGRQEQYEINIYLREQKGDENGWVIIGDWILGKRVAEDSILIRELWQHSDWEMGDCVITLSEP